MSQIKAKAKLIKSTPFETLNREPTLSTLTLLFHLKKLKKWVTIGNDG